jgi:hypothetical protein
MLKSEFLGNTKHESDLDSVVEAYTINFFYTKGIAEIAMNTHTLNRMPATRTRISETGVLGAPTTIQAAIKAAKVSDTLERSLNMS